jgi:hypothetical protein
MKKKILTLMILSLRLKGLDPVKTIGLWLTTMMKWSQRMNTSNLHRTRTIYPCKITQTVLFKIKAIRNCDNTSLHTKNPLKKVKNHNLPSKTTQMSFIEQSLEV